MSDEIISSEEKYHRNIKKFLSHNDQEIKNFSENLLLWTEKLKNKECTIENFKNETSFFLGENLNLEKSSLNYIRSRIIELYEKV